MAWWCLKFPNSTFNVVQISFRISKKITTTNDQFSSDVNCCFPRLVKAICTQLLQSFNPNPFLKQPSEEHYGPLLLDSRCSIRRLRSLFKPITRILGDGILPSLLLQGWPSSHFHGQNFKLLDRQATCPMAAWQYSAFSICFCVRSLGIKLLDIVVTLLLWLEETYAQLFLFQQSPGKLKKIEMWVSSGHWNI